MRGPSQDRQATVGLRSGGGITMPEIPGGDVGAYNLGLKPALLSPATFVIMKDGGRK